MNTRPHPFYTFFILLILLVFVSCGREAEPPAVIDLERVHDSVVTLDTHVDIGTDYATEEVDPGIDHPRLRCDLTKMERGGLDGVFLAVYVGNRDDFSPEGFQRAYDTAMIKFEAIHRLTETMHPDRCELALTPEDTERIAGTGKRAIMIGIENGYTIGRDLSLVEKYYDLGARYITLCHSRHNQICDSSGPEEPLHNGISEFGKEVAVPEYPAFQNKPGPEPRAPGKDGEF